MPRGLLRVNIKNTLQRSSINVGVMKLSVNCGGKLSSSNPLIIFLTTSSFPGKADLKGKLMRKIEKNFRFFRTISSAMAFTVPFNGVWLVVFVVWFVAITTKNKICRDMN